MPKKILLPLPEGPGNRALFMDSLKSLDDDLRIADELSGITVGAVLSFSRPPVEEHGDDWESYKKPEEDRRAGRKTFQRSQALEELHQGPRNESTKQRHDHPFCDVVMLHVPELVSDDRLQFVPAALVEQRFGDIDPVPPVPLRAA